MRMRGSKDATRIIKETGGGTKAEDGREIDGMSSGGNAFQEQRKIRVRGKKRPAWRQAGENALGPEDGHTRYPGCLMAWIRKLGRGDRGIEGQTVASETGTGESCGVRSK